MPNSAVTGRTLDEIAVDKKQVWHSNRSAKDQSKAAHRASEHQPRRLRPQNRSQDCGRRAAAKPRARTPRRKAAAKQSGKKLGKIAGARDGRLPDFVTPCLATLSTTGAGHRRLGARDQVRRLPHPGPDRRRQGHAEDPHRSRLDEQISALSKPHARRCPIMTPSSTARSPRSTKTASPISPRCRTTSRTAAMTGMVYYVFDLLHLDGQDLTARAADRAQARAGGAAGRAAEGQLDQAERALRGRRPDHAQARLQPAPRRHRVETRRRALSLRPQRRLAQDQVLQQSGIRRHRLRAIRQARTADPLACCSAITTRTPCATPDGSAPAGARRQERDLQRRLDAGCAKGHATRQNSGGRAPAAG